MLCAQWLMPVKDKQVLQRSNYRFKSGACSHMLQISTVSVIQLCQTTMKWVRVANQYAKQKHIHIPLCGKSVKQERSRY